MLEKMNNFDRKESYQSHFRLGVGGIVLMKRRKSLGLEMGELGNKLGGGEWWWE